MKRAFGGDKGEPWHRPPGVAIPYGIVVSPVGLQHCC